MRLWEGRRAHQRGWPCAGLCRASRSVRAGKSPRASASDWERTRVAPWTDRRRPNQPPALPSRIGFFSAYHFLSRRLIGRIEITRNRASLTLNAHDSNRPSSVWPRASQRFSRSLCRSSAITCGPFKNNSSASRTETLILLADLIRPEYGFCTPRFDHILGPDGPAVNPIGVPKLHL